MNPAIKKLEDQSTRALLKLLDDMFASCDDLYFDLASRAQSNLDQNLYFESMREVRVQASKSKQHYASNLAGLFSALGQNSKAQYSDAAPDEKPLEIVADDTVELDVAKKTMTSRSFALVKKPMHELHNRVESLYPGHVDEDCNPLHPKALIDCFADSCSNMSLDIKARIILLKQYERIVISRLSEILVNANKLLESLGVKYVQDQIPSSAHAQHRSTRSASFQQQRSEESLLPDSSSQYIYSHPAISELSSLMQQLRTSSGYQPPLFSQSPLFQSVPGATLNSDALIRALEAAQAPATDDVQEFDLRRYISELMNLRKTSGEAHSVEQIDEDIINLVAMFFEFVLDDHSIPDVLRALIGRLQMPVLKIALRDKSFFTNTQHVCRHFINELSRIGIGAVPDDKSSQELVDKVEGWVHLILSESQDTLILFENSLKELQEYAEKIEKRASLVEKRTSESAQGSAKQQIARMKAQKAIQETMDGKVLAHAISDFIAQIWQQVLYRTLLTQGDESPAWLEHLQTMQDLIWCAQLHQDEKSQKRLERIKPEVIERIVEGLKLTTLDQTQVEKHIGNIEKAIADLNAVNASKPVEIKEFSANAESVLDTLTKQKSWQEMSAVERQQVQHKALTYEYIERADAVAIGTWLEFKVPASGTTVRCKLAAKLNESDMYIFVNRLGFKTMERSRKDFAFDLQRKRARILKSGPLFDRSLHKLVSSLKTPQNA